ncbi:hypothetical protein EJB05_32884, partial [Eragrostis curvula]
KLNHHRSRRRYGRAVLIPAGVHPVPVHDSPLLVVPGGATTTGDGAAPPVPDAEMKEAGGVLDPFQPSSPCEFHTRASKRSSSTLILLRELGGSGAGFVERLHHTRGTDGSQSRHPRPQSARQRST